MSAQKQKPDQIRDAILAAILRGDLGSEPHLPREQDLATEFGVARPTVRAAVRSLQGLGVLQVTHGRPGAALRPIEDWNLLDDELLATVLASSGGRRLLGELLEWRALVATEAAALAAERAGAQDLAQLEAALAGLGPGADRPAIATRPPPAAAFQRAVLQAAHNRFLAHAAAPLALALGTPSRRPRPAAPELGQRVVEAIRAGEPHAAREAMAAWLAATAPGRRTPAA